MHRLDFPFISFTMMEIYDSYIYFCGLLRIYELRTTSFLSLAFLCDTMGLKTFGGDITSLLWKGITWLLPGQNGIWVKFYHDWPKNDDEYIFEILPRAISRNCRNIFYFIKITNSVTKMTIFAHVRMEGFQKKLKRPQNFAKSSPYSWLALHNPFSPGKQCKEGFNPMVANQNA